MQDCLIAQHHPDCYPSDPSDALKFFRDALDKNPSPAIAIPEDAEFLGIVAPHIDFRVSLRAYATAFRPLLEQPSADAYLILGVGHHSHLEWNLDWRDYATPLGSAYCARNLVGRLSQSCLHLFEPAGHVREHSIEFPLLWLQAIRQMRGENDRPAIRFAPLLCGAMNSYVETMAEKNELDDIRHVSENIRSLLVEDPPENVQVIASIDGCHLGPRFQHPFNVTPEVLADTETWEDELWKKVATGDAETFLEWMRAEGNDRYFDGVGALGVLLNAGAGNFAIRRSFYEQWFTERDSSVVTFSSGIIWQT